MKTRYVLLLVMALAVAPAMAFAGIDKADKGSAAMAGGEQMTYAAPSLGGDPLPGDIAMSSITAEDKLATVQNPAPPHPDETEENTGRVELRRGRPGEEYAGIRKDAVHVEGRPVLVDERGPFGNPTSDSARTMVTPATREVLVVVYAPRDGALARLRPVLDTTAARLARFSGGTSVGGRF